MLGADAVARCERCACFQPALAVMLRKLPVSLDCQLPTSSIRLFDAKMAPTLEAARYIALQLLRRGLPALLQSVRWLLQHLTIAMRTHSPTISHMARQALQRLAALLSLVANFKAFLRLQSIFVRIVATAGQRIMELSTARGVPAASGTAQRSLAVTLLGRRCVGFLRGAETAALEDGF